MKKDYVNKEEGLEFHKEKLKEQLEPLFTDWMSGSATLQNMTVVWRIISEDIENSIIDPDQIVNKEISKEYDKITSELIDKKKIYNYKQNVPEYIVEDILKEIDLLLELKAVDLNSYDYDMDIDGTYKKLVEEYRNKFYSILVKRGVTKWLLVRKLLIRLKKKYSEKAKALQNVINYNRKLYRKNSSYDMGTRTYYRKSNLSSKEFWKMQGELKAYSKIREELYLLCNSPRWVIWNWKGIGLIDFVGMKHSLKKRWIKFYNELRELRFLK
ncbi:MAG: hypothetical protein KAX49_03775 [Halanaerobiales bacterium]|nr:hypothetical protein [Halanaerobiales bacterium]